MAKKVSFELRGRADGRLSGCQRDVEVWQRILQLRSMVLTPKDDTKTWLHFADLCRTSDRLTLAEKTLTALVGNSGIDADVSSISGNHADVIADAKQGTTRSYFRVSTSAMGSERQRSRRRGPYPIQYSLHFVFARVHERIGQRYRYWRRRCEWRHDCSR
jgi:hypothetical protein